MVLLPDTDGKSAALIVEDIRGAVLELAVPQMSAPLGVLTISIGVAASGAPDRGDFRDLFAAVDAALYQAKGGERNQVVCFDEVDTTSFLLSFGCEPGRELLAMDKQ